MTKLFYIVNRSDVLNTFKMLFKENILTFETICDSKYLNNYRQQQQLWEANVFTLRAFPQGRGHE